jgi:hypothetical protein
MSDPAEAPRSWDPFGLWKQWMGAAADPSQATSLFAGSSGASSPMLPLDLVRTRLVGREVEVKTKAGPLSFKLDDVDAAGTRLGMSIGQYDQVLITATTVTWNSYDLDVVKARLNNVHIRTGGAPRIVAAPVELETRLTSAAIDGLAARFAPGLAVAIDDQAQVRLRLRRRPGWGAVEVTAHTKGGVPQLQAVALLVGGRRWRLPRWMPRVPIVMALPERLHIVGVEVGTEHANLHLRLDEWTVDSRELVKLARRSRDA